MSHPTPLLWTGHATTPEGDWSVGYSSAGVWCLRHGARGVAGAVCRTEEQLRTQKARHPALASALTVAWELYCYSPALSRYHLEEAPVRVSSRPEELHR